MKSPAIIHGLFTGIQGAPGGRAGGGGRGLEKNSAPLRDDDELLLAHEPSDSAGRFSLLSEGLANTGLGVNFLVQFF